MGRSGEIWGEISCLQQLGEEGLPLRVGLDVGHRDGDEDGGGVEGEGDGEGDVEEVLVPGAEGVWGGWRGYGVGGWGRDSGAKRRGGRVRAGGAQAALALVGLGFGLGLGLGLGVAHRQRSR